MGMNFQNDLPKFKKGASRVIANRKRILEVLAATPAVRKDKVAALKKAKTEGTYSLRTDDIAGRILQQFLLELVLIPKDRSRMSRFPFPSIQ